MEVAYTFFTLICAISCYWLAQSKKRSKWLWLLIGAVFGVIAILILFLLPNGDIELKIAQLQGELAALKKKDQPRVEPKKMLLPTDPPSANYPNS